MFYKQLDSGKYRYYEKFYDKKRGQWRQVTITLNTKTRIAQNEARNRLSLKIEKILNEPTAQEIVRLKLEDRTFQEVYDEWRLIRSEEVKPSTFVSEGNVILKLMKPMFELKFSEVSSLQIQKQFSLCKASPRTKKMRKIYLNGLFKYALKVGYINKNPLDSVVLPKVRESLDDLSKQQEKFLSQDEMKRVLDKAYQNGHNLRMTMIIEFLYLTGLRIGELMALRKLDDLSDSIFVRHTLNYLSLNVQERMLQSPKTLNSFRQVMLNRRCKEILKYFEQGKENEDFVFTTKEGSIFSRDRLSYYFKEVCKESLGSEKRYFLHMLRHSHISLLVELGVPTKSIMERVGHKDSKITDEIYTHVTQKMNSDLLDKLNSVSLKN